MPLTFLCQRSLCAPYSLQVLPENKSFFLLLLTLFPLKATTCGWLEVLRCHVLLLFSLFFYKGKLNAFRFSAVGKTKKAPSSIIFGLWEIMRMS